MERVSCNFRHNSILPSFRFDKQKLPLLWFSSDLIAHWPYFFFLSDINLCSSGSNSVTDNERDFYFCRYLEVSGEQLEEEAAQQKLEPTALSCFLNKAACMLKMQLWQDAVDSCNEVHLAYSCTRAHLPRMLRI